MSVIEKNISHTGMSFIENLKHVYRDVHCQELNNEDNIGLIHRIINHKFIRQLLQSTEKFTTKNITILTEKILKNQKQ